MTTRITRQEIPIEQRMTDILKQLEIQGGRQSFMICLLMMKGNNGCNIFSGS